MGGRREVPRRARQGEILTRQMLGLAQPERRLVEDAQAYWGEDGRADLPGIAHWHGHNSFDTERWLALGRAQLALFDHLAPTAGLAPGGDLGRVVEWGCGGG